jgi:large subunit ribosomal protein L17
MRKRKRGRKFGREKNQRKALLKAEIRALILNERIKTTEARAKEIRPLTEKFITRAKKNNLASRRLLLRFFSKNVVKKLMEEIAPRFKNKPGGYTRILKLGPRKSDGARMAIIEFVKSQANE